MTMPSETQYIDQLGRTVSLKEAAPPQKIISLVPSQTELLFDLGLQEQLIGITKYCTHPADKVKQITKVGGTKQLDLELIGSLNPDLIVANKEENERNQIEELIKHYPVWISDIKDLHGALNMITGIGEITGTKEAAATIVNEITAGFNSLPILNQKISVAYLIWRKPYMLAGTDTFIAHMLRRCGFINITEYERYPHTDINELIKLNPDVVLLSSEPYPFKQKHIDEISTFLPHAGFYLVDGEAFSWYGSRLKYSAPYFKSLIQKIEEDTV